MKDFYSWLNESKLEKAKAIVKSAAKKTKDMHRELGGGAKGAAALGATAAVGAVVPGGTVLAPLMYLGAKKALNRKKFKEWLNESKQIGPIFKDSNVDQGDYVEIVRQGENFGRIMAKIVDVKRGATKFNSIEAIRVQPTDFSTQHERKIGLVGDLSPFWMEIPYREDPHTDEENDPVVWLLNPRWINV